MTSRFTPGRVETAFWLIVCGGLIAGIGVEADWGRQLVLPPHVGAAAHGGFERPALAEPFRLSLPDTMLETATRPLFVVTRRPAPTVDLPIATMNKGQFTLTGVSIVPQGKFAFLFEKAGKRNHVVPEGKEINGITVKEVLADRVTLVQNADAEVLLLTPAKGSAVPVSPQSVPFAPPVQQAIPAPQAPQSAPPALSPQSAPSIAPPGRSNKL